MFVRTFQFLQKEFQSSKWTRFSTATTVTIDTLTMALTCLLFGTHLSVAFFYFLAL